MRFCPYCGIRLNERSKFCSQCGKASSNRRRSSAVAVEEPLTSADSPGETGKAKPIASAHEAGRVDRAGELAAVESSRAHAADAARAKRPSNGSAAPRAIIRDRRFAPPTRSYVGPLEQAGFGLRYGAWMFDFLITLIAIMTFTFVVTAVSR
ncbi:MAG TPA: zinc-ribbon domain-containing protein, partial [Blastocatellia bacterium]|nr:zinc-ribbon domain-containing protein [Blastocatellia bacterium]